MDNTLRQKIALFRYSLIAPLLNGTFTQATAKEYLEDICARTYDVPVYGKREYAPETVKGWLLSYRKRGIEGLYPLRRRDKGISRSLNEFSKKYITDIKTAHPKKPVKIIYHELLARGIIQPGSVSISTVQRFIKSHGLNHQSFEVKDRRAFCMEFPNDCWQSDICQGPYLNINGRKVKTYLIAFIDDASRTVTGYSFSFEENLPSVLSVFKTAVRRRGIPKKLYMDNGKVFRSDQLQFICASLGTIVSHTHPYDAAAKGKIERWFKTLQTQWLNLLDWSKISSLEQLNEMLSDYVENKYHQTLHSVIKAKPIDKFMEHIDRFRFVPSSQELDHIFLYRCVRKVRNDATISIMNISFEVPMQYIGEQINVRYDPSSMDRAYIFDDDGNCLHTVYPVNRVDNSKIPRKTDVNPVDFSPFSDRQEV